MKKTCAVEWCAELIFFFFFHGSTFLRERMTDKAWFSKVNEVKLSFQDKQRIVFIASDKVGNGSSGNWIFGKLISSTVSLTASQYLKAF